MNCFSARMLLLAAAFVFAGIGGSTKYELVTEVYVVQEGDTLMSIARRFMEKNTYGPRELLEFKQGIVELNYDTTFRGRPDGQTRPFDALRINYWVKKDGAA